MGQWVMGQMGQQIWVGHVSWVTRLPMIKLTNSKNNIHNFVIVNDSLIIIFII